MFAVLPLISCRLPRRLLLDVRVLFTFASPVHNAKEQCQPGFEVVPQKVFGFKNPVVLFRCTESVCCPLSTAKSWVLFDHVAPSQAAVDRPEAC